MTLATWSALTHPRARLMPAPHQRMSIAGIHLKASCPASGASLIIGHTHSMLSRTLYSQIRGVLTLCDIYLPWATIQASRARTRMLLRTNIEASLSVFENPCFSHSARSLIAQPSGSYGPILAANHLDFYPELTRSINVTKLSQSLKWLQGLSPAYRPPILLCKWKALLHL